MRCSVNFFRPSLRLPFACADSGLFISKVFAVDEDIPVENITTPEISPGLFFCLYGSHCYAVSGSGSRSELRVSGPYPFHPTPSIVTEYRIMEITILRYKAVVIPGTYGDTSNKRQGS